MIIDLIDELNDEKKLTENGAVGFKTTGKKLLDLNFKTSSLRNENYDCIAEEFRKAYYEDKLLALKWAFFLRDREVGMGERRSFRAILKDIGMMCPEVAEKLVPLVPQYGRWDDLFSLIGTLSEDAAADYIHLQLLDDIKNCNEGKPISLLAKWLPKESSKKNHNLYKYFLKKFKMNPATYRKVTSGLRKYLDVVEVKMSSNAWDKINYNTVPGKANLLYKDSFLRHDEERRIKYLEDLKAGNDNAKINAKVLMPHEIVHSYSNSLYWRPELKMRDESLEQLWAALPNHMSNEEFSLFVRDGSGSMTSTVGNSNISCLDISTALAVYFSERCKGEYKDTFITFSEDPKIIDLSNCNSLHDKLAKCYAEDDCSNTDIYKVFKLILDVAIKNKYIQEQLPKNIVICSDMEFDYSTTSRDHDTLFENIKREYKECGYELPRLVFWNICSRTNAIPLKESKNGVCLVSGFSPAIMDMVLSTELDPYKCLVDKLNSDRYASVEDAVKNVLD